MLPPSCRRLAEVDFPIARVGASSAREKAGPKGHPSMLQLWWARRPLASCRSAILGLLLPDPCDASCPPEFKQKARRILRSRLESFSDTDENLQRRLLDFVGDVADWNTGTGGQNIETARALIRAAWPDENPVLADPFAGGGSIPVEGLRLGCDVFASDLNPVAVLALSALLESIPKQGKDFGAALRTAGSEVQRRFTASVSDYYPSETSTDSPIAYLWARTIRCETPNCQGEIPLVRSFWLAKRGKSRAAIRYTVPSDKSGSNRVSLEVFVPRNEREVPSGTIARGKATCPFCRTVIAPDRVVAQLAAQGGGADVEFDEHGNRVGGAFLLAVVGSGGAKRGRSFRAGTIADYRGVWDSCKKLEALSAGKRPGPSPIPDEAMPPIGTLGFRVQRYGVRTWGDLFTRRQLLALVQLQRIIDGLSEEGSDKGLFLALAFNRVAMSGMSLTRWNPVGEKMQHTFGRQALPMVWDFAEVVPFADAPGGWASGYELAADVAERWPGSSGVAHVAQADARESPLPDSSCSVWFTDPPYYDAVPYADLSDFFFVWLKRFQSLRNRIPNTIPIEDSLTPKTKEAVQDSTKTFGGKPKDRKFFEASMAAAFGEGRRVLRPDGIGCVVFAHKTTEGWEALLSGLIKGGWVITASWPMATEMGTRLRARDSAALSTSVHLICRPRPDDAPVGDWAEVAKEVPERVLARMEKLSLEGLKGADLIFSCIGPAMEVYSRYSRVVDAMDREIPLGGDPSALDPQSRGFLAKVWEVVGRIALAQVLGDEKGGGTGLEEDARLTALFLWAAQGSTSGEGQHSEPSEGDDEEEERARSASPGGLALEYDVVRRFSQPLGIHLEDWEGRVIETDGGVVRLLPVTERGQQLFKDSESGPRSPSWGDSSRERQTTLFPDEESPTPGARVAPKEHPRDAVSREEDTTRASERATTLDRLHKAMLMQAGGATTALRRLLQEERARGPEFERLTRALTALYPPGSEERRLVEALALVIPR
jgi:putative DNA methylase